jgi:hypothetical protein
MLISTNAFSQVTVVCNATSNGAKNIAQLRISENLNKRQLQERLINTAKENKTDDIILDSWMSTIDWLYKTENLKLNPEQVKDKYFDKCRNELKDFQR